MKLPFPPRLPERNVPRRERVASLVIMFLLAAVAVAVWITGRMLDPRDADFERGTPQPAATQSPKPMEEALRFHVAGLEPQGPVEIYPADRLFEKIDGRDAAYQAFGVKSLRCLTLALSGHPDRSIDVYVYDMGEPDRAKGIFSKERDPKGVALDFVKDGYRSGPAIYFCHGALYVQLIALDLEAPLGQMTEALAREIAGAPAGM